MGSTRRYGQGEGLEFIEFGLYDMEIMTTMGIGVGEEWPFQSNSILNNDTQLH